MALRVLLADESTTIKKVMQLALHDYAVEVRSVPVGLDVLPVAKVFKPDIVFADVLLTKRSGYDVCMDLKKDPQTSHTPVVLMWSGFMDLDQAKFVESKANQKLEKPFDSEALRNIVKSLVPKTNTNLVSEFLSFPQLPDFVEPSETTEHGDEFAQVPLTGKPSISPLADSWSTEKIDQLNIPSLDLSGQVTNPGLRPDDFGTAKIENTGEFEEVTFINDMNLEELDSSKIFETPSTETLTPPVVQQQKNSRGADLNRRIQEQVQAKAITSLNTPEGSLKALSANEEFIREQAKEMIEKICWQIVPEITERIVREEINKLLKDVEKSI